MTKIYMIHGGFIKKILYPIRKTLLWVRSRIIGPYLFIRFSWPVWFYLVNREGRLLQRRHLATLSDTQSRIVADLKKYGYATTHIDELFPNQNLLAEFQKHVTLLISQAQPRKGKVFLRTLWKEPVIFDTKNPFMQFALRNSILEVVNAYLGVWSKIRMLRLEVTIPVDEGEKSLYSQRWHRDPEDKRMCKMFIYVNDVDETSGPFTYASSSHYGGRNRKFFPQVPPAGSYPPAGAVEKAVSAEEIKSLTGKAGTIIFADTSGLHKGGYATKKKRIMFTAGYNTKASLWKREFDIPQGFVEKHLSADGSMLAHYALQE